MEFNGLPRPEQCPDEDAGEVVLPAGDPASPAAGVVDGPQLFGHAVELGQRLDHLHPGIDVGFYGVEPPGRLSVGHGDIQPLLPDGGCQRPDLFH